MKIINKLKMNRREALERTALIMGTALTPGLGTVILNGCRPEVELNWNPSFLSVQEAKITGQIADRIIPQTETPGALDVGVDQFIDKMLNEVYSTDDGISFKSGIENINNISKEEFGKEFVKISPDQKDALLKKSESSGDRFFKIAKELTLIGYFTSEEGMRLNFEYRPVPGEYKECVPYSPGDKTWIGNQVFNV
jgi:gluconate 2-dehydrogenase gamma chain